MDVEGLGVTDIVAAPDAIDEHVAGEHAAGVLHQQAQQLELLASQVHLVAAHEGPSGLGLEAQASRLGGDVEVDLLVLRRGAPQHGAHAGHELAEAIGLGDIVIGTHLETDDRVDLLGLGRHHDDRGGRLRADLATDVESRDLGDHQIEQHEVRGDLVEELERLGAVDGDGDLEPLVAEADLEGLDERGLVLDQQDPGGSVRVAVLALLGLRHVVILGIGRTRVKVEPSPSRDSTSTVPWWFAATCRTIESPRPVPPVSRLRPRSTR